jgi:hypothetical protein
VNVRARGGDTQGDLGDRDRRDMTHMTKRQEELLRELAEIENKQVSFSKSFFDKIKNLFTLTETDAAK